MEQGRFFEQRIFTVVDFLIKVAAATSPLRRARDVMLRLPRNKPNPISGDLRL